ncbi:MAG: hypothetical protein M3R17_08850 [Bacteroidota bacterium]|nr:hypothetical protein [Bacteroidota bacterium]
MLRSNVDKKILENLSNLEKGQKSYVLFYIKSLVKKKDSKKLLKFAGAFGKQDLKQMEFAIQEGCEDIDGHEW